MVYHAIIWYTYVKFFLREFLHKHGQCTLYSQLII